MFILEPFSFMVMKFSLMLLLACLNNIRSNHSQMFIKIGVLKNFAYSIGKHLCWSLFIIAGRQACNVIKKRLQHRCFPKKFEKFLRTTVFTKHSRWLLLRYVF